MLLSNAMAYLFPLLFILLFTPSLLSAQQIFINEFMSSNKSTIADSDGDFPDWIEIYNPNTFPVQLEGYFLSDDYSNPKRWTFPDTFIHAKGHLIIFASGKNQFKDNELHTNFSIRSAGEELVLSNPSGVWLDWIDPVALDPDISFGRATDGEDEWVYFSTPTPGKPNDGKGEMMIPPDDTLRFSMYGGFIDADINLEIEAPFNDIKIYYTLDGSEPDLNSILYETQIRLDKSLRKTNTLSQIKTAPAWQKPSVDIPSGIFLRAAAFKNGKQVTHIKSEIYFFKDDFKNLKGWPIFSLILDSADFFGNQNGIYVPGDGFLNFGQYQANYYQRGADWEREVHLTFFNENQEIELSQQAGARIHGSGSRNAPQKSLRLYARGIYGENYFNFPFFKHKPNIKKYKRLFLRTTMGDWNRLGFSDEFSAFIVRPLNLDYMEFLPVLVFLNGEFWGIHHLRERVDKYFFMFNHGVHPEKIDYLDGLGDVNEGSANDFFSLKDKITTLNPKDATFYAFVSEHIDLENFADYYIAKIYLNNLDWPFRNYSYWRPHSGKWRWVFYDCDGCFIRYNDRNMVDYLQSVHYFPEFVDSEYHQLIRQMFKNEEFRHYFFQRFAFHLTHHFHPKRLLPELEKMAEKHRQFLELHIKRWHFPDNLLQFENNLSDMRRFIVRRYYLFQQTLQAYSGNAFSIYPNPLPANQSNIDIQWHYVEPGLNEKVEYQILDMSGKIIESGYLTQKSQINIRHLNAGNYIIIIKKSGMQFNSKLTIQ